MPKRCIFNTWLANVLYEPLANTMIINVSQGVFFIAKITTI